MKFNLNERKIFGTVYKDKSSKGPEARKWGWKENKDVWRAEITIDGKKYRKYVHSEEEGRYVLKKLYNELKGLNDSVESSPASGLTPISALFESNGFKKVNMKYILNINSVLIAKSSNLRLLVTTIEDSEELDVFKNILERILEKENLKYKVSEDYDSSKYSYCVDISTNDKDKVKAYIYGELGNKNSDKVRFES